MPPITFPLRLGDKGSEIVNLQNGLLFLLRYGWATTTNGYTQTRSFDRVIGK